MEKNNKIILTALVILMIGAFSFNYIDTTGKTVGKGLTSITVMPKDVKAGDFIYITVEPGKQGVYQEMEVYRVENDLRMGGESPDVCRSSKCFEKTTISYKLSDSWDNNAQWDYTEVSKDYYVRVYDIYMGKWVSTYFSVERLYPAAGPEEHR